MIYPLLYISRYQLPAVKWYTTTLQTHLINHVVILDKRENSTMSNSLILITFYLLPRFCGIRVTRSLVLRVCFVDHCLYFCTCSFGHCVVCFTDSDNPFDICKLALHVICLYLFIIANTIIVGHSVIWEFRNLYFCYHVWLWGVS